MNDFSGFYKLSMEERLKLIKKSCALADEEAAALKNSGALSLDTADRMIENTIGAIHLPLGLAMNFKINGKEVLIPMALEEPSVIAGASKAAKLCLPEGFQAGADESVMIGQVQLVGISNMKEAIKNLEKNKIEIMAVAKESTRPMEKFGGGARNFDYKIIKTKRGEMLIVNFYVAVSDAMGANMVNTLLEYISPTIIHHAGGKVRLRIISNLATKRLARAIAIWKKDIIGEDAIDGILDAYEFASNDIYRCATHNKGIMNGIDAVALATANDWRAIEAGAHAYASLNGYHSLTKYEKTKSGDLVGRIELPIAAATVGGAVNTSPTGKIALKILGANKSQDLAMAMACVGLANNFAALYALSTTGIQQGHMKLHARNIAVIAGASTPEEIDKLAQALADKKDFTTDFAKESLKKIRGK